MDGPPDLAEDRRLGHLRIHVARPAAPSRAGVLLLPTIFGLDDAMRGFARDLAGAGLTAVVWDPYDGTDGTREIPEMLARSKERDDPGVVADLTAIVDHLEGELGVASAGAVGWCFGGRLALVHAGIDHRVRAVAAYNPTIWPDTPIPIHGSPTRRADFPGQTLDEFALAGRIAGPVQVSRPEHDLTPPGEYERLLDALLARDAATFYDVHPGAAHGFSYTPGPANARAHRLSWPVTLALLSATLVESAP